jgi:hypothetical protein
MRAMAFFFMRQPSRPNLARPVTKSGKAVGSGTVRGMIVGSRYE